MHYKRGIAEMCFNDNVNSSVEATTKSLVKLRLEEAAITA